MSSSKTHRVLPGYRLTLGFTVVYLSLIVLIPLAGVVMKTATMGWKPFWDTVTTARAFAAYRVSFWASLAAGLVNVVFGFLAAWVLVRYRFPGKKWVDALVDLPLALPTAVAGIALTTLYSRNGWMGRWLEPMGIKVAYTPIGIWVALTFVGLPFVVRTLQPVIESLDVELEEAAASLGASGFLTFRRVILPTLYPAMLTGFALAFARAIGEYGSVVFISGNIQMKTEIIPLLIMGKLEQFDYAGATAFAVVMLVLSFLMLLGINMAQAWSLRRTGGS